ncbi:MAG TPA: response regulator transcription factor [Chryseosolibacter sp.]
MSTKLKCILLDDEIPGLTYLKMLCQQIEGIEVIKAYNDPQKLIAELNDFEFDLCILDIEMPQLNGLQVANLLKDKLVIFTTAYKQYAADAFDVDAVDYVRKPVQKERLQQAIRKAIERSSKKDQEKSFIQLNTDRGKTIIHFNKVGYVTISEADSRDKIAVMEDGSSLLLKNISFESIQDFLPKSDFCRINKQQIIAMKIVESFTFNEIITSLVKEGKPLRFTLSEVYRQQFQRLASPVS